MYIGVEFFQKISATGMCYVTSEFFQRYVLCYQKTSATGMCFVTFKFFQKTSATGMCFVTFKFFQKISATGMCCVTFEFVQKTSATAVLPLSLSRIPVLQEHVCAGLPFAIGKCWVTFCYR